MQSFRIGKDEAGQRLDKYLKKLLAEAPDGFLYKMLRKKNITVNGKKAGGAQKLAPGDEVTLFFSDETFRKFSGRPVGEGGIRAKYPCVPLDVLYEDEDILAINKPVGMLSQKAAPLDISANEYIIGYLLAKGDVTEQGLRTFRPSVCGRLDRNTSGVLLAGKSLKGLQEVSAQLRERRARKYYLCLTCGHVKEPLCLEGRLGKEAGENKARVLGEGEAGGKIARTYCRPLSWMPAGEGGPLGLAAEGFTLLEARLDTGRSHQIRAQLSACGHPIVGDPKYGDARANAWFQKKMGLRFQLLHASRLELDGGPIISAPPGECFTQALRLAESLGESDGNQY